MSGAEMPWWRAATIDEWRCHPTLAEEPFDPNCRGRWEYWQQLHVAEPRRCDATAAAVLHAHTDALRGVLPHPSWADGLQDLADTFPVDDDLLAWLAPVVTAACERLRRQIRATVVLPEPLRELPEFVATCPPVHRFAEVAARVLLLELHIECLASGAATEPSWAEFMTKVATVEGAVGLRRRYPVLVRHVVENLDCWVAESVAFLTWAAHDWSDIAASLLRDDVGRLVAVDQSSDYRRAVGAVRILRFERGTVVFKPRSLAVDQGFASVLHWLARRRPHYASRVPATIDCDAHGWMEFVAPAACDTPEQVDDYFRRAGALAGLVHLLGGLDLHAGNIIAAGNNPVLIDLETLLAPGLPLGWDARNGTPGDRSLLHTGLVPGTAYVRDGRGTAMPFDHSGFSDTEGRPAASTDTFVERGSYGEPVLRARRRLMGDFGNLPIHAGRRHTVIEHKAAFLDGLDSVFDAVQQDRASFTACVRDAFTGVTVRWIPRPVRSSLRLLAASLHPNLLRDGRDRDVLLERLRVGVVPDSMTDAVAAEEIDALRRGLVADFWSETTGTGLVAVGRPVSRKPTVIEDFWRASALDSVLGRIASLDSAAADRQMHVARIAIASADGPCCPELVRLPPEGPDRPELAAAVMSIVMRLLRTRVPGESPGWETLDLVDGRFWIPATTGPGLWHGTAGIGLFLAAAGSLLDLPAARNCAEQIGDIAARQTQRGPRGLNGAAGRAYFLAALTSITGTDRWLPGLELAAEAAAVAPEPGDPPCGDLAEGAAGSAVSLTAVAPWLPSRVRDRFLDVIALQVEATAHASSGDGLLHGRAGVELARWRLGEAGRDVGIQPCDVDRSDSGRDSVEALNDPTGWVAGAAGHVAAGAMLRWSASGGAESPGAEIGPAVERAADAVVARWGGDGEVDVKDLSWGCGAVSGIEALTTLATWRADDALVVQRDRLAAATLQRGLQAGWSGAGPAGVELPGLLVGWSGIGYGLLRLLHPELPNLTVLAKPAVGFAP